MGHASIAQTEEYVKHIGTLDPVPAQIPAVTERFGTNRGR